MTESMKAIRQHQFGGPEVLRYEDAPMPQLQAEDQVLIQVHAAGINPVDVKTRAGQGIAWRLTDPFPLTVGWDVSGVVEQVGSAVTMFRPGDEVYGMVAFPELANGYAEYIISKEAHIARKPAHIDHVHAAGMPLAALTAWQAIYDHVRLQAGETVLIHAAAGGVGHFAVQLAREIGAQIIGTASAANAEFVRVLGATRVIDYQTERFEDVLGEPVDVVLDFVGGETQTRSFTTLKKGGRLISITGKPDAERAAALGVQASNFLVSPNQEQLERLAALVDNGRLRPEVGIVFPLLEAQRAHELSETRHLRGKIVLRVR